MWRYHIPIAAGILTAVFTAGLLLFPHLREEEGKSSGLAQARPPANQPVPVITAIAAIEPFTESVKALGTAKANESVVITPTVEERITGIFFEDGQSVQKYQVLVKLDDSEAQFLLAEAKATLSEQQQQYERMRRLAKTNATSRSLLDEEKGLLDIARAKVDYLKAQMEDYTIRAPFSGILGIRQVSVGAVVDSESVISTLDDTTVIKLDFTIPEMYLGVLKNEMTITAVSPAYPNLQFKGKVTAIGSRVDPETRTLTIRAQIPNSDRLLKPGMLLSVDLVKDQSRTLVIPEESLILEKNNKFVLLVTPENRVEKRQIVTGRRSPGKVEVISGLNAGNQVIIEGINRVRPDTLVNIVEVRRYGPEAG